MAIDERRIRDFLASDPTRKQVAAVFQAAGFQIAWVHQDDEHSGARWSFNLKLSGQLKNMLGTNREVLVCAIQSAEFQARDISAALKIIADERPRLCEDFCIVLTHDARTGIHAQEAAESFSTTVLGYSFSELVENFKPAGTKEFLSELRTKLYSRDLYNIRSAVTRMDDFYGRKAYVQELTKTLLDDHIHLGVFGLRKVGKTSLVNRLRTNIRSTNSAFFAHIDVEKIDAINPSSDYLLWSLGEAVFDSHRSIRSEPEFLMFGRYPIFSKVPPRENIAELFSHDIELIMSGKTNKPLILVLDEIERMSSEQWGSSFVRVFRLLRGIDQENSGKLRLFATGTNPSLFEANKIHGEDNPAFNYFNIRYLKSLDESDTYDLMTKIGRRMGIEWTDDGLTRIYRATSGHPALLRAFGSLVHRNRPKETFAHQVDRKLVESLFDKFLLDESPLLSQLTAVLADQYPDEAYLLELLAAGRIGEFRQYVEAFPKDAAHLVGYGLCDDPSASNGLSNELLHTFLQARLAVEARGTLAPLPGQLKQVGPYQLSGTIGRPGGFAHVYAGKRISDYLDVAVKVFDRGSLLALQREIEPLTTIKHPAVVEVIDYGQTDTGIVYMVMELLHGDSMRQFCNRSGRANIEDVISWTETLLSALKAIHPDVKKIEHLHRKAELTEEEARELQVARHGFIHRDIKPENIMLTEDGPVLIDFNISVRASSPVRTVSATPGYLPRSIIGAQWGPDIDLFQLGLTMLQISTGFDLSYTTSDELRNTATAELDPAISRFLLRLSDEEESKRFRSAESALSSLRAVAANLK